MPAKNEKIPVEFAINVVRKWKETYRWVPILGAFAAIALAFSAGANNIPAPFIKENQPNEGFLMWSIVIVLISATIWLTIATYLELPVSSQQATQGALLGTMLVTEGFDYIPLWNKNQNHNFKGGGLLWIFLEWTVAPLFACMCAYFFFFLLKASILRHENARKRILIFLPVSYGISTGLLCLFLTYQVTAHLQHFPGWATIAAVALATFSGSLLSLVVVVPLAMKELDTTDKYMFAKKNMISGSEQHVESQDQICGDIKRNYDDDDNTENALREFMQMRILDTVYEEEEQISCASPDTIKNSEQAQSASLQYKSTKQSTPFKELLESTPNKLVHTKNFQKPEETSPFENASNFIRNFTKSTVSPVIEYDRKTLIRHALAEKYDGTEDFFSLPQILASCIFALIQSASEIAAVVSPYGAIVDIFNHRTKYSGNGEDVESVNVSWWFRALGGLAAMIGFFRCGWKLTQSLGGKLTYMSNSRGLASQLSTVTAVIIVSRTNLPVSSVHAFVGSLVGVGIADDLHNVNWKLLLKFLCGWIMTIIFCCGVAYVIFSVSIHAPAYAVP